MKMADQDSYDLTTQERLAMTSHFFDDGSLHNTVVLQVEVLAAKVNRVILLIDRAKKIKLSKKRPGESKDDVQLWYSKATTECMNWTIELFNNLYHDPTHINNVEPVTRSIWKSTMKLFTSLKDIHY